MPDFTVDDLPTPLAAQLRHQAGEQGITAEALALQLLGAAVFGAVDDDSDRDDYEGPSLPDELEHEVNSAADEHLRGRSIDELKLELPQNLTDAEVSDVDVRDGTFEMRSDDQLDGTGEEVGNASVQVRLTFTGTGEFERDVTATFTYRGNSDTGAVDNVEFDGLVE